MADGRRIINRTDYVKNISVQHLLAWCRERDLDPITVTVTGSHLKWTSPETDEEQAQHLKFMLAQDQRTENWERETLPRLAVKYGYVLVPKGDVPEEANSTDPATWPNVG